MLYALGMIVGPIANDRAKQSKKGLERVFIGIPFAGYELINVLFKVNVVELNRHVELLRE